MRNSSQLTHRLPRRIGQFFQREIIAVVRYEPAIALSHSTYNHSQLGLPVAIKLNSVGLFALVRFNLVHLLQRGLERYNLLQ